MKICRYNDDRLGIVIDGAIHDVTSAQNEIRAAHPYASKSDAIVAALSDWRDRLEHGGRGNCAEAALCAGLSLFALFLLLGPVRGELGDMGPAAQ